MIALKKVNKIYHHKGKAIHALRDIDLSVERGEIFGIVGESGAGKSTLIRCANLLEIPTSGEVLVDGQDLTRLNAAQLLKARHNIGMIFQHFNLLSSRTVYQNIALPLELIGYSKDKIKPKISSLLELTGLTEKIHHYPAQLSGGQKQRVAIARALASEPKVLLSDEATSALDPETTESILKLLKKINEQLGLTILLITHEMEVVKKICDKVALIQDGRIIENSDVGAFFTNPQTSLGHHFVGQSHSLALPENMKQQLQAAPSSECPLPVLQLKFNDDNVSTPLISSLSRRFNVDINIIEAKIENIQNHTLGLMIARINGAEETNQQVIRFLENLQNNGDIELEVLGYDRRHH